MPRPPRIPTRSRPAVTEPSAAPAAPGLGRASALLASGTIVSRVLGFVQGGRARRRDRPGCERERRQLRDRQPAAEQHLRAHRGRGAERGSGAADRARRAARRRRGAVHQPARHARHRHLRRRDRRRHPAAPRCSSRCTRSHPTSGRGFTPEAIALATAFAYWCLPQIFFYALYSLLGEVLNARNVFGPFTWAPVLNNVVAIAGLVVFMVLFGDDPNNRTLAALGHRPDRAARRQATLGVAAQALVLFLFWRRAGLRYRPDFRWRGVGLGATGQGRRLDLRDDPGHPGRRDRAEQGRHRSPRGDDASNAALRNAWLIFMLPHSSSPSRSRPPTSPG